MENARSKFRQETFETLAKFNLKKFRVVLVLFSCCFLRNPFALSTCTLQTVVARKNHAEKRKRQKIFRKDTNAPVSYTHKTCLLSSTAATAPLFHLFGPVPLFVLASEKCDRRSVRQFIELSVRAGCWFGNHGVCRGGPSFCLFFNLRLHRRHDGEKGTLRSKRLTLYTTTGKLFTMWVLVFVF